VRIVIDQQDHWPRLSFNHGEVDSRAAHPLL
jgi:hypothetical protein